MSTQGRFSVILFYFMKCGTPNQDTQVLNLTSKNMPHGAGYDYDDTNLDSQGDSNSRKRKRIVEDMVRQSEVRNKTNSELVATMKTLVGIVSLQKKPSDPTDLASKAIVEILQLTKHLNEMKEMDDGTEMHKNSIALAKLALQKAKSRCAKHMSREP